LSQPGRTPDGNNLFTMQQAVREAATICLLPL